MKNDFPVYVLRTGDDGFLLLPAGDTYAIVAFTSYDEAVEMFGLGVNVLEVRNWRYMQTLLKRIDEYLDYKVNVVFVEGREFLYMPYECVF